MSKYRAIIECSDIRPEHPGNPLTELWSSDKFSSAGFLNIQNRNGLAPYPSMLMSDEREEACDSILSVEFESSATKSNVEELIWGMLRSLTGSHRIELCLSEVE